MVIMLLSDSQNCIGYLKGADVPWNAKIRMRRIKHMVERLEDFQAIHILQEAHRLADRIAALHLRDCWKEFVVQDFTSELNAIVQDDATGKTMHLV